MKKVLSLFSGCGGMDLGFEGGFQVLSESINRNYHGKWVAKDYENGFCKLKSTSFETVFANDILPEARTAWMNYFSQRKQSVGLDTFRTDSIVELVKRHKSGQSVFPKNIDIITGGFPCQDFSVAGKRNGFSSMKSHTGKNNSQSEDVTKENRGMLYYWMREVIGIVNPKMFIAENVKGLTTLENVKEIIEDDFRSVGGGYIVVPARVLKAYEYGVPQSRERVIFIGFNKQYLNDKALQELTKPSICSTYYPYPKRTHCLDPNEIKRNPKLVPFVNIRIAFRNLLEPECEKHDLAQTKFSRAKFYGNHCQGSKEVHLNWIGPTIRAEHHGNIEFRRLSKQHGGKNLDELNKGLKERRLSVRECARIQTFPDDYNFIFSNEHGSLNSSKAYKVIGNAVPPLLAYHIASRLEKKWDIFFKKG